MAVVLGRCGVAALVVAGACGLAWGRGDDAQPGKARVGMIEVNGSPGEVPHELAWLLGDGEEATLSQLVDAIRGAATNANLAGVVIRLKDAELHATQVEELGAAIRFARGAGKKVHLYSESWGPTDLMLASYCDGALGQQGGPVSFPGVYMEEMYLADTLAWAGVKADMVQVGDYKGASEAMARSGPSKEWDANINQLLDSMYTNLRAPILAGRHLTGDQLDGAMNDLWMANAEDAAKAGLLDGSVDLPTIGSSLRGAYGMDVSWAGELVQSESGELASSGGNPLAMLGALSQEPSFEPDGPTIAVLHITGTIVDGESAGGGGLTGGGPSTGSRTIRNAMEDILKHEEIRGVVVRIDSPGGSATASETIWQGVRRVAEKKPVWVSVGSMAASGGYYIAVAGDKVYVNPSSIVGSIGVVGGKMTLTGAYEKLKVHVVGRGRGPRAQMFASHVGWDAEATKLVRTKMTETYELFTKRVTMGREGIDLAKTAEGRLFTGDRAIALHMADKVGGLDDAITDLAAHLDLGEDYSVMDYPAPRPPMEVFREMVGNIVQAPGVGANVPGIAEGAIAGVLREALGDRAWRQVRGQVQGLWLLRDEHVLLVGPTGVVWK